MFVQHRARGESHAASSPAQSYIIYGISILHTLRPLVILYQILFAICGVNTRLTPHISLNNPLISRTRRRYSTGHMDSRSGTVEIPYHRPGVAAQKQLWRGGDRDLSGI